MWATILGLLSKLLDFLMGKNAERSDGERLGVAETQAAADKAALKEASDAARTQDAVSRLSDDALDRELRDGAP